GVHEDVAVAVLVDVLHVALVEVSLLDLAVGVDLVLGDGPRLEALELELELGAPVPRRVEVAVHDVVELAVLADDDHALADLTVFDRSHDKPPSAMGPSGRASSR